MESRRGHGVRHDSSNLFRISARRIARAARPDLPPQSNGPARTRRAGDAAHSHFSEIRKRTGTMALSFSAVSRICERRGDSVRARKLYAQSIARELPQETDRAARSSLARLAKRDGDLELARGLWESMLGNSREGFEAYEQLAIYYEHRAREPHRAAALARKALLELRNANRLGTIPTTSVPRPPPALRAASRAPRTQGRSQPP